MICNAGQGILGKIDFKEGSTARYFRPYLVVDTDNSGIYIIDVSSTEDKEHKLIFDSNYELNSYDPPFIKPSFVKLDSKRYVAYNQLSDCRILKKGAVLNQDDFANIIEGLSD